MDAPKTDGWETIRGERRTGAQTGVLDKQMFVWYNPREVIHIKNRYIPSEHYERIAAGLGREYGALCDLLRLTGYRVDDFLHTRCWQWDRDRITVRESKTGHARTVLLTPEIRAAVQEYRSASGQDRRPRHPLAYFVESRRKRPGDRAKRCRTTLYRHFQQAVKRAGFEDCGYSIHSLRKCYARDAYRRTGSLVAVQKDLGHKKLDTTLWYVCGSDISL